MSGTWYEYGLTVEAAFGYGPYDASPVWTDITAYAREPFDVNRGRTSEFSQYAPGTATLILDNRDRRFDPEHAAGPYFGDLVPMVPVRIQATYSATDYGMFYGFALGWPQAIGKGYTDGEVRVQLVDATRLLSQAQLVGCPFRNEIVNDGAIHYWPLQTVSPTDASTFLDEIGTDSDLTIQPVNPLVGGSPFPVVSSEFGSTDITKPIGRPLAPRLRLYDLGASSYISDYLSAPRTTDSVTGYGIGFWARMSQTGTDQVQVAFSGNDDSYIILTIDQFGFGANIVDDVANIQYTGGALVEARWTGVHYYSVWCDGSDIIGYVDGIEVGREAVTTASTSTAGRPLCLVTQLMDTDDIDDVKVSNIVVFPDGTEPDWLQHYAAGLTGYGHPFGEGTGTRINRWLNEIGWPSGSRSIAAGDTVVGPYDTPGSLMTQIREMERVEQGLFYISKEGEVTFRDRTWQFTQTSAGTFGDDPGDIQFRDIQPDGNIVDAIRNQVEVTWRNGTLVVSDQTSIDAYGIGSDSISSSAIPTQVLAQMLGAYIVRIGKDPRTRITFLRIHPRRDPATTAPVVLGLDLGDVITVDITPLNVGSATTYTLAVQGIRHRINRREWVVDLYLAPADLGPYFIVGDATLGRIGAAADNRIPY